MTEYKWMQNISKEIFAKKYMINDEKNEFEVFEGIAETIAAAEETPELRETWKNKFYKEIAEHRLIPAGRILANARTNARMPYYNNCYTIGVDDSIEEIYASLREDAQISRTGGGVGMNFSKLRPVEASLSTGGKSSGVLSFMKVFNESAKIIQTGGARRAAHIAILNVDHPEIEAFITAKQGDSNKELTQFNISVGITDKFMEAVENDSNWDLVFDNKVYKTVKAKYLYNLMTENAYMHNEPGILNLDTVNKYNNGYYAFDIQEVNPCFTGETLVAVADGRNAEEIGVLAVENEKFPVYSGRWVQGHWKAEIKEAIAFKTGEREVVRVNLSDGTNFKCTPEHRLAKKDGGYIEAKDAIGINLGKFYSYSNKNSNKSYRTINSKSNGYARQYRMLWEFSNGKYDTSEYQIDHINNNSILDKLENLQLISIVEHKVKTDRTGKNNPINKMSFEDRSIYNRHKNVLANAKRYSWSEDRTLEALEKLPPLPIKEDKNVDFSYDVFVESIENLDTEEVFDLTVEDNHNFYIITKTDDNYLNCSGVLVHNCGEICVTGDTRVNTDLGILQIKDLIQKVNSGETVRAYSVDKKGKLNTNLVTWGDKTGVKSQTIEIHFRNKEVLKLTPNHKLFISPTQTMTAKEYLDMWNDLGKRAKRRGEYPHLVNLNRSMQNEHYVKVKSSTQEDYVLEHHLNLLGKKAEEGLNVHHLDENTLNNSRKNLEKLKHETHSSITNIGHPDYNQGVKVKKKSVLKHRGDTVYTNVVDDVRWGEKEDVYDITVEEDHNFFANGILVHNCMPAYSLCCLSSVNLTQFVKNSFTRDAYFDLQSFQESVAIGVRFLDNVLSVTKYPLEKIEELSKKWRRIGLGFTGLADAFAMMRITYGSQESFNLSKLIGEHLRDISYASSITLAKEKGSFPGFDKKILESNFIKNLPESMQKEIEEHGLRNIALNTTAPTGTTSLSLGQNCSSGIEPIFSLSYNRNIRTGFGDEVKQEKVHDYAWLKYIEWRKENDCPVGYDEPAPDFFATTFDIDVYNAMEVQIIFQKYIDHSISKTLNLPNGTTFEEYKDLFKHAYNNGLKGFTTFNPEGSMKGILETNEAKKAADLGDRIAPKRPTELNCDIHTVKFENEKYVILIGMYDENYPYEIFVTSTDDEKFNSLKNLKGKIIKNDEDGLYSLMVNGKIITKDLSEDFGGKNGGLARFISMDLRHKIPLQFIVDQLNKTKEFLGFERTAARVLKRYIRDGEVVKSSSSCPECGNKELVFKEGCQACNNCGWSRCS